MIKHNKILHQKIAILAEQISHYPIYIILDFTKTFFLAWTRDLHKKRL